MSKTFFLIAVFTLVVSSPAQTLSPADTAFNTGLTDLTLSKFVEAEADFRQVIQLEPGTVRGYLGVTQVYMAQKKTAEAIAMLRAEAERQSLRLDLRVMLGDTAARAGQYDVALAEFKTVLSRLDPKTDSEKADSELNVPRGAVGATVNPGVETDMRDASIRILTSADVTPKGAAGLHLRIAEVYRMKQDHASSFAEWKKVAESIPTATWVLGNLGVEAEAAGDKKAAIAAYRAALVGMPANAVILNNLAYLIADTGGDLVEAGRYAHRAASLAPGSPDITDTEGYVALKRGYVDDAIGSFTRAFLRAPAKEGIREHLAMALIQKEAHSPDIDALIKALKAPKQEGDEQKILELMRKASGKQVPPPQ